MKLTESNLGSPGELLLPATLIIRCALPLPGTDLRIFRQKSQDAEWDEIEISSLDYIYDQQTVELSVQTAHLGTFVVGCCAGRSVQTVHKGQVHQIGVGELKFWAGDDFRYYIPFSKQVTNITSVVLDWKLPVITNKAM